MEYPFKDLMPLDEVLEREGYYKDWTHLDPEVFYSLTQISEYIKTKGYGVDVRLLIAQLAEHFGLKTTQVVDLGNLIQAEHATLKQQVQQAVAQVNADRNALETQFNQSVAQMEADKNTIVANATVDSEVILARGGKATLGERLDETTAQLAQTERNIDGLSSSKVGGGVLAEMGDLSQSVKESLTGGSVAVVGEGAVAKPNLANDLKVKIEEIDTKEDKLISDKNIFNPDEVNFGYLYLSGGGKTHNADYNVTPKYPVNEGDTISISGAENMWGGPFRFINFWNGPKGDNHLSSLKAPNFQTSDYFSFTIPPTATHFSVNIEQKTIPKKLQIEKSKNPTSYEPYHVLQNGINKELIEGKIYTKSKKNLYDGRVATNRSLNKLGLFSTQSINDCATSFVPVDYGKHYTISGLTPELLDGGRDRILGYSFHSGQAEYFVKDLGQVSDEEVTIYIDDERVKYIIIAVTGSGKATYEDALENKIQVEEGKVSTPYEPYLFLEGAQFVTTIIESSDKNVEPSFLTTFTELDKVRSDNIKLGYVDKDMGPFGLSYILEGDDNIESVSNNLYAQYDIVNDGEKEIYVHMANYVENEISVGELEPTAFTIPSGQLGDDVTLSNFSKQFNNDDYVHPDVAFDPEGVAGYKYWMITSIFPQTHDGNATWEDEDLFVSNDGRDWKRVRSLYESEKDYTAPLLSLPPHTLVTSSSRKHAFLPIPDKGDTIEISAPEDNGAPALDRKLITLTGLPWKHDPAIFIDNGYVYTYHSFNISYDDRPQGKNRFIVCVRTNDGINWEVVRTDGSTMLLTEETSREIFTKDEQGRYNYMYYSYSTSYGNPKILKYGEEDYEFVYGYNFSFRVKGTTPYNFDFSDRYPMQSKGSTNHPALLLDDDTLYLLDNKAMFVSSNRGESFTEYPHYPAWLGGLSEYPYKKALCLGENGKVILFDVQFNGTTSAWNTSTSGFSGTFAAHQMYLYEYPSLSALLDKAQNGLIDGYVDLQIVKVNYDSSSRSARFYPYISNTTTTQLVKKPMQRLKIADLKVSEGDILFLYVTLNSRSGAKVSFGGIEIV